VFDLVNFYYAYAEGNLSKLNENFKKITHINYSCRKFIMIYKLRIQKKSLME
jgi:hypothetical protein